MEDLIPLIRLVPEGYAWLWAACAFLLAAMNVSTCRRILAGFSRKSLLEGLPEAQRNRTEKLLLRVDHHAEVLRAIDQVERVSGAAPGMSRWDMRKRQVASGTCCSKRVQA